MGFFKKSDFKKVQPTNVAVVQEGTQDAPIIPAHPTLMNVPMPSQTTIAQIAKAVVENVDLGEQKVNQKADKNDINDKINAAIERLEIEKIAREEAIKILKSL